MKKQRTSTRKKQPASKREFDFLYLLERTTNKTFRSILFGELEIKIGITNKSAKERKEEIDLDMPGNVVLHTWIFIPQKAQVYEAKLLKKWNRRLNPRNTGPSAGRTEWRRVTWLEYLFVLADFAAIRNRKIILLAKLAVILSLAIWAAIKST